MIFIGDIHGNFRYLMYEVERLRIDNANLIQVGDFGIGFNKLENDIKLIEELNTFLLDRNIIMYVIRGNHDNPNFFNGDYILDNIKFIPDYTVINIESYNVLFVGGALSIDRKHCLELMTMYAKQGIEKELYWHDEMFNLDVDKLGKMRNIDVVVTHTAPTWCYPVNIISDRVNQFAYFDNTLLDDLASERNDLDYLFKILNDNNKVKYHYYGHFHASNVTEHNNIKHTVLDINEFKELYG